jgi:hypothetical protein
VLEGYTGWHGAGKTYNAVAYALQVVGDRGVPLVTNAIVAGHIPAARLLEMDAAEPLTQDALPLVVHFETWDDLMVVLERAIERRWRLQLLVDEAGKFLSSRFYSKLDPRVLMVLQERRKVGAGLDLIWTAPHFDHVDKILRDVTQVVHVCKRFGGSEYSHDGGRPPRAFWVRSYRPNEVGKANAKTLRRRLVPFVPELASLYTTGVLAMATPMAAQVNARPELRDPAAGSQPPHAGDHTARPRRR